MVFDFFLASDPIDSCLLVIHLAFVLVADLRYAISGQVGVGPADWPQEAPIGGNVSRCSILVLFVLVIFMFDLF